MTQQKKLLIISVAVLIAVFGSLIALSVLYGWIAGVIGFVLYISSAVVGALYTYDTYVKPLQDRVDELEGEKYMVVDVRPHAN